MIKGFRKFGLQGIWSLDDKYISIKGWKKINEAPRRKRTGYQSGIKTNLDDGGKRCFPPHPPSACLPHRKRMGYKKS